MIRLSYRNLSSEKLVESMVKDYQFWKGIYPESVIVKVLKDDVCVVHIFHDVFDAMYTINFYSERTGYDVNVYFGRTNNEDIFQTLSGRYKGEDDDEYKINHNIIKEEYSMDRQTGLPGYAASNLIEKFRGKYTYFLLHDANENNVIRFEEVINDDSATNAKPNETEGSKADI